MNQKVMHFEQVTLLITHYNRSQSLERLLDTFISLGISFGDIVVSDDCSKDEHLALLRALEQRVHLKLVTATRNKGLANNINKGEAHIQTPYTLYVQEDFVPTDAFPKRLENALAMMEGDRAVDLVKFYAYIPYPYLKEVNEFGFSEMYLPFMGIRYTKIYQYTDHPHLRRRDFIDKFGKYDEGIPSDRAEYNMCLSFIRNKGKGYFYTDFTTLFVQANSAAEPSTVDRLNWRNSRNVFVSLLRNVYRQIKYNVDIYFKTG